MARRIRLVLPGRWFADSAPVLEGLLAGLGTAWSGLHGLLGVVRTQSRLLSCSGSFLDLSSTDLFGQGLRRRVGEGDGAFRGRIVRAMRRERGTRAGVVDAALESGAGGIVVFEPGQPADTGVYGGPGLAWGTAGGWGSLSMPLEALIVIGRDPARSEDGAGSDDGAVLAGVVAALPAGGAAWVRFEG